MRSSNEVYGLVHEIQQGFTELKTRAQERDDQIYATKTYQASLVANLPELVTNRVAVPSRRLNHAIHQTEGILRRSWQLHVEATSGLEREADKIGRASCRERV